MIQTYLKKFNNFLYQKTSKRRLRKATIPSRALNIIDKLKQAGFKAYLVGGGVRDILLAKKPKDFDIASDATPEEIAKVFKNCRIIGRRFRLAHIHFGREFIEVATFRANHEQGHPHGHSVNGMIIRDNVYGSLQEDASRRDFTLNALYYDPSSKELIDIKDGVNDLQTKTLRLIGDPTTRYREDPVRMLRAIRFAAKLDLHIEKETAKPIKKLAPLLLQISSARLFDEVIKLFHSGHALASFELLLQYQLFTILFPYTPLNVLAPLIRKTLSNTDQRILLEKPVTPAFIFAALLWENLQEKLRKQKVSADIMEDASQATLQQQKEITSLPNFVANKVKEIWALQHRFFIRHPKRAIKLLDHPRFRAAFDFFELRAQTIEPKLQSLAKWWHDFQFADHKKRKKMLSRCKKS